MSIFRQILRQAKQGGAVPKGRQGFFGFNIRPSPGGNQLPDKHVLNKNVAPPKRIDPKANEQAKLLVAKNAAFLKFNQKAKGILSKMQNSPSLKPKPKNNQLDFSDDILTVSRPRVVQGKFVGEPNRGISVFRPEILAIVNFKPIYVGDPKDGDFSKEGRMIEVQHQAAKIRGESLLELQSSMLERGAQGKETADEIFKTMQANFQQVVKDTDQAIDILGLGISKAEEVSNRLNIKRTWARRKDGDWLKTLQPFFENYMGFTQDQFDSFSNTKIFVQLLSDYRQVLENYSFNLLDIVDSDRAGDTSAINIDTTVTLTDGFSFTSAMLRSPSRPINAAKRQNSDPFLKALPKEAGDRIKLLVNFLSKEYRFSRALGTPGLIDEKLSADWGSGTEGTPFDNIIGMPGKTVFDQPLGDSSLLTLAYENALLPDQPNAKQGEFVVLPFEQKYVDSDNRTFVPGSSFYVDRFFDLTLAPNGELSFNTGPLTQFADRFQDRVLKAQNIVFEMHQMNDNGFPDGTDLQPSAIYNRFADALKDASVGININMGGQKSRESLQCFSLALMNLANTDRILKNLVFQYLLMMGMLSNVDNNPGSVWATLAIELEDLNNLPAIKIADNHKIPTSLLKGPKVISPFMDQIAGTIERQIRHILLKGLEGTRGERDRAKHNPKLTRDAIARFQEQGKRAFSNLGIPVSVGISTEFIKNALLQIANETTFEKDSNIFREFVDTASQLADAAARGGNREYLIPDDSGRTRFNLVSTSHQMLAIFEIFSSMVEKFTFCSFSRVGLDIAVNVNSELTIFTNKHIADMAGPRFDRETTYVGGFSKILNAELGADNPDDFANQQIEPVNPDKRGNDPWGGGQQIVQDRNGQNVVGRRQPNVVKVPGQGNVPRANVRRNADKVGVEPRNPTERQIKDNLYLIKTKLEVENQIVRNFAWILDEMGNDLKAAKDMALRHFDTNLLRLFNKVATVENIRIFKDPAQIRSSAFLNDELNLRAKNAFANQDAVFNKEKDKISSPIIPNTVNNNVKEALYTYAQEPEFQAVASAETLMKIFSIGVPAEFVQNTQDRISFNNISRTSFKKKEADVFTVNVHKRDLRRPELIFKPQKFLFDASLFTRTDDVIQLNPQVGDTHDFLLKKIVITDFNSPASIQQYSLQGKNDIRSDVKYFFLSERARAELIENHYQSYLLETYIKMTTGMAINEKLFLIGNLPPREKMDPGFEKLLLSYLKDVLGHDIPSGQSTQQLLNNSEVEQGVKDILRSVIAGQAMANPETEKERILRPKKFDRVLHVPVNIDDFEIDKANMVKSNAGKEAFDKVSLQNVIRKVRDKDGKDSIFLKTRTDRDIVFEDYFVTLESQND